MEIKYLWDTNTVIYFLQKQFPKKAENFIDSILDDFRPALSVITEIELLCWNTATESDMMVLHKFIAEVLVFELENDVKLKTSALRKAHKIKLPDAIIAATALVYDLTLITRNEQDFKKVSGLSLVNPYKV